MRLAVFVFSLILLVAQTTAFAIVPLGAVVAGTARGGGVLILRNGGRVIKTGLKNWSTVAMTLCLSNKSKCLDLLGDAFDPLLDNLDSRCIVGYGDDKLSATEYISSVESGQHKDGYGSYTYRRNGESLESIEKPANAYLKSLNQRNANLPNWSFQHAGTLKIDKVRQLPDGSEVLSKNELYVSFYYKCKSDDDRDSDDDFSNRDKELERIIGNALRNKLSDDDVTNIYNNYGDKIDIDIDVCVGNNTCTEIEKEFGDRINNKEYDITKITPENCEMNGNKIKDCPKARYDYDEDDEKKDDEEQPKDPEEKDDDQPSTPPAKEEDDDDQPAFCKSTDLTKEICEFLDWVDDDPEDPKDEKVKIEDEDFDDDLSSTRINIEKGCPPNLVLRYSIMGSNSVLEFDYKPLCSFAEQINPYLKGAGLLVSFYIITGVRRDG